MITQETVILIYAAHREILAGEKLLEDMKKFQSRDDKYAASLKDVFGRPRQLQLGIPTGESGHQLFDVSPVLAESMIRAHIANKRKELVEANERARAELDAELLA